MKKNTRYLVLLLSLIILLISIVPASAQLADVDWKVRHDLDFYKATLDDMEKNYPDLVRVFSIGHSWRERDLWTAEITSPSDNEKTGIYIVGNIHGGEQESAESTMYFGWWLVKNSEEPEVKEILDNYIIYVTPVMNPDGYVASMVYRTRQNLRPTDANGDGKVFSDPYTDTNGDGFISEVYQGAADSKEEDRKRIGMESPDWDKNGIPGDDPKNSKIDLNRTFDYMWNRMDVDMDPPQGGDAFLRAGPDAASEPEVKAVQNFLLAHPVHALVSVHTGIQCVLWPWCHTDEPTADHEFMKGVAEKMAEAFGKGSGRSAYAKQSFFDYPTAAEMIDWSYGRLGIHSYTLEVYAPGHNATEGDDSELHRWGHDLPEVKWEYLGDWQGLTDIWFRTSGYSQVVGIAPPDQDMMVEGAKDAFLEMIKSEPYGDGPKIPEYLTWGSW